MSSVVGVVGLGIMGGAIASNLAAAGWKVFGFDLDQKKQSALTSQGVHETANIQELASRVEVIISSLPSAVAVRSSMLAIAAASERKVVIEASTISLEDKFEARQVLHRAGHIALDCPISGTGAQAQIKDVVVYASGDSQTIAKFKPVFLGFARDVYDTGDFGNGSRMKFVANLLVAIHNVAAAEAICLASKAGLDLSQVVNLVSAGAGTSRVFELRAPMMASQQYRPATMKLSVWQKDLSIIKRFADWLGSPTPLLNATLPFYEAAVAKGLGESDTAAVFGMLNPTGELPDSRESPSSPIEGKS